MSSSNLRLSLVLAPSMLLSSACCSRPASPVDAAAVVVPRAELPGVVAVMGFTGTGVVCTGSVVKTRDDNGTTIAWVLTAKHCVQDIKGEIVVATSVSANGSMPVLSARVALAPSERFSAGASIGVPSFDTVGWTDDWAILELRTKKRLTSVPLFGGDPERAVGPGTEAVLQSYFDPDTFEDARPYRLARPHEHHFRWTGRPSELLQRGHSGSPVLSDGKLFAILVGGKTNSIFCRIVAWCTWPTQLRFVSIAAIRRRAAEAGMSLD